MAVDCYDLAYWYPLLAADERLVQMMPRTEIVPWGGGPVDLWQLCDGQLPSGYWEWQAQLQAAGDRVRDPGDAWFLRTGHTADKHAWTETCFIAPGDDLARHVYNLVEFSVMFDLPVRTWVARQLLDTRPLCYLTAYRHMPLVREFRLFVQADGVIEHVQPYWPTEALEQGRPDFEDWEGVVADAGHLRAAERRVLGAFAVRAWRALCGGSAGHQAWSIDFLQDRLGAWWLTDVALAERSTRYDVQADRLYGRAQA